MMLRRILSSEHLQLLREHVLRISVWRIQEGIRELLTEYLFAIDFKYAAKNGGGNEKSIYPNVT
jgi:hypothetical protein